MSELEERLKKVKRASVNSGNFTTELKNKALEAVAVALEKNFQDIKNANHRRNRRYAHPNPQCEFRKAREG